MKLTVRTVERDILESDLVENLRFRSAKEMQNKLAKALAWAKKNRIPIYDCAANGSIGAIIEVGESSTGHGDVSMAYWTDKKTWAQPALRKLVQGAVAYLFMRHPLARRRARAA